MPEKPWTSAFGKASETLENQDVLLGDKVSERRRKQIDRQEQLDDATHEAKMSELTKKKTSADAAVEKTGETKVETGGLKITGGVDFGKIDFQEERREAKTEAERLRKEVADSANRTSQDNNQLREQLHAAEMREIKAINEAAIASIRDKIDGRSPTEIIKDIRTMAAELGLKQPDPGVSDPSLQLQIIQMQNTEAAREREFQWQMRKDREDREDKKEERADNRAARAAEQSIQREKNEMFAKTPEMIGTAIAKGMLAGGGETEVVAPPKGKMPGIQAGVGESGTTECIQCHQPVGIGPTARTAVCAGCGAKYSIERVKAESPEEPEVE